MSNPFDFIESLRAGFLNSDFIFIFAKKLNISNQEMRIYQSYP